MTTILLFIGGLFLYTFIGVTTYRIAIYLSPDASTYSEEAEVIGIFSALWPLGYIIWSIYFTILGMTKLAWAITDGPVWVIDMVKLLNKKRKERHYRQMRSKERELKQMEKLLEQHGINFTP